MEKDSNKSKEWIKIYPIYLDKAMKKSEGRKLGTQYCVENPSIKELFVICKNFNLETVAEDVNYFNKKIETSPKRLDEKRKSCNKG